MKHLISLILIHTATVLYAQDASQLYEKAYFLETATGDPAAALKIYRKLAVMEPSDANRLGVNSRRVDAPVPRKRVRKCKKRRRVVRLAGLEPARLAAQPPQGCVSANSTITAADGYLRPTAPTLQVISGGKMSIDHATI